MSLFDSLADRVGLYSPPPDQKQALDQHWDLLPEQTKLSYLSQSESAAWMRSQQRANQKNYEAFSASFAEKGLGASIPDHAPEPSFVSYKTKLKAYSERQKFAALKDFPLLLDRAVEIIIDAVRRDEASAPYFKDLASTSSTDEYGTETQQQPPASPLPCGKGFLYTYQTEFNKDHDFWTHIDAEEDQLRKPLQLPSGREAVIHVSWHTKDTRNFIYAVLNPTEKSQSRCSMLVMVFGDGELLGTPRFTLDKSVQEAESSDGFAHNRLPHLSANLSIRRKLRASERLLLRALRATVMQKVIPRKPRTRSSAKHHQHPTMPRTRPAPYDRDDQGNEAGDDIWPSPDEPFPYGGGGWSRNFNSDGTIHHFQRDCPHCSSDSRQECPYCGGTGAQRIGRGGSPISKREIDQYWDDAGID
jgi:hypothetical protein